MKDEIKEILDKFDKVLENYELEKKLVKMSVDSICHLFPSEMITIKDYITNLQEEIEKQDYLINKQDRDIVALSNGNKDYKSRNEKAIEYIERCRDYHKTYHKEEKIFPDEIASLLMILKGSDK